MKRSRRCGYHRQVVAGTATLRRLAAALLLSTALLSACSSPVPPPSPTAIPPTPAATPSPTTIPTPQPPALDPAGKLARNCEQDKSIRVRPMLPGQLAIDFTLKDTKGKDYRLASMLAGRPVVMLFGSLTSPQFRGQAAAYESLYAKYGDAIRFVAIYSKEDQPAPANAGQLSRDARGTPVTQATTYKDRLAAAAKLVAEAKLSMPVLVDGMDNALWCTYGRLPGSAFLIGADGIILARDDWGDAQSLLVAIREKLGIWR